MPCSAINQLAGLPVCAYRVVGAYPHDPQAFTQGLVFSNGVLYESTGLRGRSSLRQVDLGTGQVLRILDLPEIYFAEGLTLFEGRLIQLTLSSHLGFVYDQQGFELLRSFEYPSAGWGLTHDGQRLIMSDGSATLRYLDPRSFEEAGQLLVTHAEGPLSRLNELEYVRGEVFANVWQTDLIARISPQTGLVEAWIDLQGILSEPDRAGNVDVLNGIAYDAEADRLFVTGKLWPKLFEIELLPDSGQ